ncbi:MAG TPA: hypothetical protein VHV51_03110 [Polyangiaceae bacterium]|jgi:hypothetical protein|nr:hypothetical protein [Polyangiaceae bacterium]
MSGLSIQDARDFVTFAGQTLERLARAEAHSGLEGEAYDEERGWLGAATRRVRESLERVEAALNDAALLPEFASARKLKSEELANAWADAIEAVFDAIVANVSANGPLVEALFPHQRFMSLRKPGNSAQNFWREFERRAESSYVRRLCADPAYSFLPPLLEAARASEQKVRELGTPKPLPEAEALALREAVSDAAQALELALRQARALVEAAFAAAPSAPAELALDAKPKRRAQRAEKAALPAN